jgi:hypothetical protein
MYPVEDTFRLGDSDMVVDLTEVRSILTAYTWELRQAALEAIKSIAWRTRAMLPYQASIETSWFSIEAEGLFRITYYARSELFTVADIEIGDAPPADVGGAFVVRRGNKIHAFRIPAQYDGFLAILITVPSFTDIDVIRGVVLISLEKEDLESLRDADLYSEIGVMIDFEEILNDKRAPVLGGRAHEVIGIDWVQYANDIRTIDMQRLEGFAQSMSVDDTIDGSGWKDAKHELPMRFKIAVDGEWVNPRILRDIFGGSVMNILAEAMFRGAQTQCFTGVKDACNDLAQSIHARVTCGRDIRQKSSGAVAVLVGGGGISVAGNAASRLCSIMNVAWQEGCVKDALVGQGRLMPLHDALFSETLSGAIKHAASPLGLTEEAVHLPFIRSAGQPALGCARRWLAQDF